MIVYSESADQFVHDCLSNNIEEKILHQFKEKLGNTSKSEIQSWQNSMMFMSNALLAASTPKDANVAIEYKVPNTNKRIDFLISGQNELEQDSIVIVELKQWEKVEKTNKDGIVKTFVGKGLRELNHPSHQAHTYKRLIQEYNVFVQENEISIEACAYLHNCKYTDTGIEVVDDFYREYLEKAPLFLRTDTEELQLFLQKHIKYGDQKDLIYKIEHGRIRPSKSLAEVVGKLLQGSKEFDMIDDQKIVFESIMDLVLNNETKEKRTIIVEGGPGTGKSVVAINLLATLIQKQINTQYVSKNAAPRAVYSTYLKQTHKKTFIDNLFKGSGSYVDEEQNKFDCLIIDEAHRLNEKSGMFKNMGFHQVQELIHSSLVSVFFVDENQKVTVYDVGDKDTIKMYANELSSTVYEFELSSQFRCAGSDGYIAWLDDVLEIRSTANTTLSKDEFDFQVFDDPNEMYDQIVNKNTNNKARMLAGYCWDWPKEKRNDSSYHDIRIPDKEFSIKWNLSQDGSTWAISPNSIQEAGCIHTVQGLELDHVGVIIGLDMRFENGSIVTDVSKRSSQDQSVKGFKTAIKNNDLEFLNKTNQIIKNTYKTLLSRGLKSCYVYCVDQKLSEYLKSRLEE